MYIEKHKIPGDYLKQVKASRPLGDGSQMASDGRADRCAVLGEHIRCLLRESSVFAALNQMLGIIKSLQFVPDL